MKELDVKIQIEESVKQKKQVEHELIGKIIPYEGHTIWEINKETGAIERAKFSNATYNYIGENKKEIIVKQGHEYVSALNKKNALRKYKKGLNGSKDVLDEPYTL